MCCVMTAEFDTDRDSQWEESQGKTGVTYVDCLALKEAPSAFISTLTLG